MAGVDGGIIHLDGSDAPDKRFRGLSENSLTRSLRSLVPPAVAAGVDVGAPVVAGGRDFAIGREGVKEDGSEPYTNTATCSASVYMICLQHLLLSCRRTP